MTHHRLPPPIWSYCSYNSATCHPDISLWVLESQTVLRAYQMTLARSVQISKCDCDWYACNHQLGESQLYFMCSAESPQQWKANSTLLHVKVRPKRPTVIMQNIFFFSLWEVLLLKFSFLKTKFKPSLMSFIWVKKAKGIDWEEK